MNPRLSLHNLRTHDATAKGGADEMRFLCPLPECRDHQSPSRHRSVSANSSTGQWHCHRCGAGGILSEFLPETQTHVGRPTWGTRRGVARLRLQSAMRPAPPLEGSPTVGCPHDSRTAGASHHESVYDVGRPTSGTSQTRAAVCNVGRPTSSDRWTKALGCLSALDDTPGAAYLAGRALPLSLCRWANVRFSPRFFGRPAVVFAVQNFCGQSVAAIGRYVDGRDDPKGRSVGAKSDGLFVVPGALLCDAPLVVTEAPIDALSLAVCGVWAVALGGASVGQKQARQMLRTRAAWGRLPVYAAFDGDDAGNTAAQHLADALAPVGGRVFRFAPPDGCKDWNDALLSLGAADLGEWLRRKYR